MQKSFADLEYATRKKRTRRDVFLDELERLTPWAALEQAVAPFYPESGLPGRPPIGLSRMLRMYLAQQCFGLSDVATEEAARRRADHRTWLPDRTDRRFASRLRG